MPLNSVKNQFETIIGLEIHVQLATKSKLFCGCSTEFGAPPNTHTCHVCTGMPGALPVLNGHALNLAIKTGIALNCQIERCTKWDRKSYFYPDLPKGYQISQLDQPICYGGSLAFADAKGQTTCKQVRFERAHLEEDAGKSNHDETGQGRATRIDLNRAGVPLLEIVTKPDLRSSEDAKNFLSELKLILTYIDVSGCNMQQGNLRVDANVNLMIDREKNIATPIVEIKNLNSFRAVERAIDYEVVRQLELFRQTGGTIDDAPKQTRGWDDNHQVTILQREKEDSSDYRYFPDPDLVPINILQATVDKLRNEIGELPHQIRKRLIALPLSEYDADVLVRRGRGAVNYFDDTNSIINNPKLVSNWIQQDVLRFLNENNSTFEEYPVTANTLGMLLVEVRDKKITQNRARDLLSKMVSENLDLETAKQELGFADVDPEELLVHCQKIVRENPKWVSEFRSGNTKIVGAMIGKVRQLNSNANPNDIRHLLIAIMEGS